MVKWNTAMKFSFIIAAYNVEKYITQCINSIVNSLKNRHDYEILVINDGSKDNTYFIVENLLEENKALKLFDQKNSGVSITRNTGIHLAKGEYVFFIDGDDYLADLPSDDFYNFIDSCNGSDAVVFPANSVKNGKISLFFETKYTKINDASMEVLAKFLEDDYSFGWCAWHYVFRRNFLIENKILFPEGRISEEVQFTLQMFLKANNISVYNKFPVYTYRMDNVSSLTRKPNYKFVDDIAYMIKTNLPIVNSLSDEKIKNLIRLNYQTLIIVILSLYHLYNKTQKKEIIRKLKELVEIYNIDKEYQHYYRPRERIVNAMLKMLGYHCVGWMWGIKKKLWR